MPFQPTHFANGSPAVVKDYMSSQYGNPLDAPGYVQQASFLDRENAGAQKLQSGDYAGKLQLGQQSGDIQSRLQAGDIAGKLQLGTQQGDIEKYLQSNKQTFEAGQHEKDIDQARWLETAQETNAQRLQSSDLSAKELMQGRDLSSQWNIENLKSKTALAPLDFAKQKFNEIFPWLQGQFNSLNGGGGGAGGFGGGFGGGYAGGLGGGGGTYGAPQFVQTPGQVQQQVNASRARNDQTMAGNQARMQSRLTGQGFSSNSPLAAALSGQMQMGNLNTNSDTERNIRQTAAEQNANQATKAAQLNQAGTAAGMDAAAKMYGSNLQAQTDMQRIAATRYSSLLSALGGIIQ